jgi:hypothetical protein
MKISFKVLSTCNAQGMVYLLGFQTSFRGSLLVPESKFFNIKLHGNGPREDLFSHYWEHWLGRERKKFENYWSTLLPQLRLWKILFKIIFNDLKQKILIIKFVENIFSVIEILIEMRYFLFFFRIIYITLHKYYFNPNQSLSTEDQDFKLYSKSIETKFLKFLQKHYEIKQKETFELKCSE